MSMIPVSELRAYIEQQRAIWEPHDTEEGLGYKAALDDLEFHLLSDRALARFAKPEVKP